jgi:hypothetical protein
MIDGPTYDGLELEWRIQVVLDRLWTALEDRLIRGFQGGSGAGGLWTGASVSSVGKPAG